MLDWGKESDVLMVKEGKESYSGKKECCSEIGTIVLIFRRRLRTFKLWGFRPKFLYAPFDCTRNVSYNKQISLHILSWTTGTFHRSPSSIHFEYSCYLKRLHFDTRITSLDTIRKDRSIRTTTYISSYNLVVIIPLTIFEKNTYQLKICGLQPYN